MHYGGGDHTGLMHNVSHIGVGSKGVGHCSGRADLRSDMPGLVISSSSKNRGCYGVCNNILDNRGTIFFFRAETSARVERIYRNNM